ncbi:uncharacterized protein LOC133192977 [Saccostrea echinata]|uniref:uncharacterized protein LOC133192977 n=1 Tax=Saccostrea echinata TaxID=191078 RepID=UPI002A80E6B0|nr:uncharacterized protein LOC133192977 [Saccostrea echinata]
MEKYTCLEIKLLSLFLILGTVSALNDQQVNGFSKVLDEVIKCKKIPGGIVTVVENGSTVFTKSFGYYDLEKTKPIKNETKFCLGSLTKAFTSAVIAKLLSDHESYTWDTPIAQIMGPSFRLANDLLSKNVNFRDLLAHKVGVPSNFGPLLVGFPENLTRQQFIEMLPYQEPSEPFRTKFLYSNYMYTLAGYVAERMSGKSWEELVREILFQPLEMDGSGFVNEVKNFSGFSPAFVYVDEKLDYVDKNLLYSVSPSGPAGSIYSTAEDMSKWMNFHLGNGSTTNGSELIADAYFSELHREQINTPFSENNLYKPIHPISDMTISYCLGWISSIYRGYRKLWHSGGIAGFSSMLWLFPDLKSGVFVALTGAKDNKHAHPIYAIVSQAADLLLGEEPWLNQSTACSFPAPWKEVKPIPRATINETHPKGYWNISVSPDVYAGLYGHLAFGNITVKAEEDRMLLYYGRFGEMMMLPINKNIFFGYFLNSLSFVSNSDGNTRPFVIEFKFNTDNTVESLEYPVDLMRPQKTSFKRIDKLRNFNHRGISNSLKPKAENKGFRTALSMAAAWCLFH